MNHEYVCKKKIFRKKDVSKAQLFFRNGDFFLLSSKEITDLHFDFYDTLIVNEKGFSPVVKSGYIRCKFSQRLPQYDNSLLYNVKEYKLDRKAYLENRCLNEGGLYYIRLFNHDNWHDGIFGDIVAYKDGDDVVLSFQANRTYGTANQKHHTVMAPNVTKQVVEKIDLDFENCDSIEIFQEEIIDMQINFEKELEWNSSCYGRQVRSGFIRLKFNKEITWRKADVYGGTIRNTVKNFEKRLCGKGEDVIDICNLYVTYQYAGYSWNKIEHISTNDVRSTLEIEGDAEKYGFDTYVSGYAKKEDDGSILIVFGKKKGD